MSQQSTSYELCGVCGNINFDRHLSNAMKAPIKLGTCIDVQRNHDCPFCRLVVHALDSEAGSIPRSFQEEIFLNNGLSWKLGIELSPYDHSRSETYSNKYDLRSKVMGCQQTVYRFLVSSRSETDTITRASVAIQYLAHKERNPVYQHFFGRKVDPHHVNIPLLKRWLGTCAKWHEGRCTEAFCDVASFPKGANMRLVDVNRRCVIRIREGVIPEYVALSYMWGTWKMKEETGMEPAVLLRDNITKGLNGDEKTPLPTKIPKTIEDAMELTRILGYRYLWVDALCIIQDSLREEKGPDLANMKLIYSSASLTIAAAAGAHADIGIPGVGVSRPTTQYSEVVNSLRLATMFPSYSHLENSPTLHWNTRGWTFQEKLLSKRILLFTDCQTYFKCCESIWTEEIHLETEQLSKSSMARDAKFAWRPGRHASEVPRAVKHQWQMLLPDRLSTKDEWDYLGSFLDYASAVEEFTKRQLTDPEDVLFAISGVIDTIKSVTEQFTLGLSESNILESLLWYPKPGCSQTYEATLNMPSWTWASWKHANGAVSFDLMDVRKLRRLLSLYTHVFSARSGENSFETIQTQYRVIRSFPGTVVNFLACLMPLMLQSKLTVDKVYYSNGKCTRSMVFRSPESALAVQDIEDRDNARSKERKKGKKSRWSIVNKSDAFARGIAGMIGTLSGAFAFPDQYLRAQPSAWTPTAIPVTYDQHVLIFMTAIVSFAIGKPLQPKVGHDNDEVGIFELNTLDGETVGEVVTTYRQAQAFQSSHDFLTISCGFSLRYAQPHPDWTPRWCFNGDADEGEDAINQTHDEKTTKKIEYRKRTLWSLQAMSGQGIAQHPKLLSLLRSLEDVIPGQWMSLSEDQERIRPDSVVHLFNEFYTAQKDAEMPRALWPVVNIILVNWDEKVARRAGVGKVLLKAWEAQDRKLEQVVFG